MRSGRKMLIAAAIPAAIALFAEAAAAATAMVTVVDGAFQPSTTQIRLGGSVEWTFAPTNTSKHSSTDNTGLGIWDSGLRAPGATFTFTFPVSGTFAYHCMVHHEMMATMKVVPVASPSTGTQTTTFMIRWASAIPAGDRYNVQMKGPQDAGFVAFRIGTTAVGAAFVPNEGVGSYLFRAQLRSSTAMSQFSPARAITVTS